PALGRDRGDGEHAAAGGAAREPRSGRLRRHASGELPVCETRRPESSCDVNPIEHDSLERALGRRLDDGAAERLDQARARVAAEPPRIAVIFPGAGRMAGRGTLTADAAAEDPHAWTLADAARTLLLVALGEEVDAEIELLYKHGDGEERRA